MTKMIDKTTAKEAPRLTVEAARELKKGDKLILSPTTRLFQAMGGTEAEVGPKGVHPSKYPPYEILLDVRWPGDSGQMDGGYNPANFLLPPETLDALEFRRGGGIAIGSTVRVKKDGVVFGQYDLEGREGTVVDRWVNDDRILLVDFGEGFNGHTGNGSTARGKDFPKKTHWYVPMDGLEVIQKSKREKKKRLTPQSRQVLEMIQRTGRITGVQAWNVLKVRSLSRRIADLKTAGYNIISTMKTDHLGQRYAEYTLGS